MAVRGPDSEEFQFAGAVLEETLLIHGHMVARLSQASARESHSSSTFCAEGLGNCSFIPWVFRCIFSMESPSGCIDTNGQASAGPSVASSLAMKTTPFPN